MKLRAPEPTMKPNTFKSMWKKPYTHLESLIDILENAAEDSGRHASELTVDVCSDGDRCTEKSATVILEAEGLSDGSIVYNVFIH